MLLELSKLPIVGLKVPNVAFYNTSFHLQDFIDALVIMQLRSGKSGSKLASAGAQGDFIAEPKNGIKENGFSKHHATPSKVFP